MKRKELARLRLQVAGVRLILDEAKIEGITAQRGPSLGVKKGSGLTPVAAAVGVHPATIYEVARRGRQEAVYWEQLCADMRP